MSAHGSVRPVTALLGVLALLLVGVVAAEPVQAQDVTPARIEGQTRVDTAAEVAVLTYPQGAEAAVVGRADDYPDTLAAASLAGQAEAPVLLAYPDVLPERTLQALDTLGAQEVYVLGGPAAIGPGVVDQLSAAGYEVTRLGGEDRFETAAEVARETVALGETNRLVGDARTVFIAYGGSFEDALAAGAPAAAAIIPILLVEENDVPDATVAAIQDLNLEYAYVLGGQLAVAEEVVAELETLGMGTRRLAGQTAQGTATTIAGEFSSLLQGPTTVLARGDVFADALSAGPHAAAIGGPILLTVDPTTLGDATRQYLSNPPNAIDAVRAIGGRAAITSATLQDAVELAAGTDAPGTQQTYVVAPQEALTVTVPGSADFSVIGRYGQQPITEDTLDVALFPCGVVDAVGSGTDTFTDDDGDGFADGLASTDTGEAAITVLNDTDVEDGDVKYDVVVRDGRITFRVASGDGPDCTVPVVWNDENQNGQLDVGGSDTGDVPVEPYGVGKVTFE